VFFSSTGSFPHDWSMIMMWNLFAMLMLGTVMTMIRLRQEEVQREIDSLRRLAHAF
jgi:hypothetical protein